MLFNRDQSHKKGRRNNKRERLNENQIHGSFLLATKLKQWNDMILCCDLSHKIHFWLLGTKNKQQIYHITHYFARIKINTVLRLIDLRFSCALTFLFFIVVVVVFFSLCILCVIRFSYQLHKCWHFCHKCNSHSHNIPNAAHTHEHISMGISCIQRRESLYTTNNNGKCMKEVNLIKLEHEFKERKREQKKNNNKRLEVARERGKWRERDRMKLSFRILEKTMLLSV